MNPTRIVLPGGAGLVGQNLVARLKARGYTNLVVLDKHEANLDVLRWSTRISPPSSPTWRNRATGQGISKAPMWS